MLQIAIIVFREILEIALIIGILSAATKDIKGSTKWILSGLGLGILASLFLAISTDKISDSLDGMGQEFFNGLILVSASFLIGWTIIWMQKHAKSISGELKRLSKSVQEGRKPLYILAIVVLLSTVREGAEIVLFTYGYFLSGTSISQIILGLIIGSLSGITIGLALYLGILKASGKYFFMITTWLLIFLSCGILSQGLGFWISADLIPALGNPAIDLTNFISQKSIIGKILNMFFGYVDRPAGMQLIAYFSNLAILILGLKIPKKM